MSNFPLISKCVSKVLYHWVLFVTERFDMVSVSLFKCACDVVLCVICVVCYKSCRVYYVPSRVFFLKWACISSSAVATVVSSTCGLFFLIMRAMCDKWKWNLPKTTYFLIMEIRGSKVIATIYLTSPWAAIWRSWSLRTYRPFHTEPSRQKIWKWKHQPV